MIGPTAYTTAIFLPVPSPDDELAAHHRLHQLDEAHRAGEIGVDLLSGRSS